jgi:branched-chain amino acid transport system substrate-binding protein
LKEQTSDFTPDLREFKLGGAEGIYIGGTDDQNACIPRKQMASMGIDRWPYGGSDGIATALCIDDAAPSALGMLVTNVGPDTAHMASAQSTIRDFMRAFPRSDDLGHFTMTAFDATGILIHAIKAALGAGGDPHQIAGFRETVRANVAGTVGYAGSSGTIGFDRNGDTTTKVISIYRVEDVATGSASHAGLVCGTHLSTLCFVWVKNVSFDS